MTRKSVLYLVISSAVGVACFCYLTHSFNQKNETIKVLEYQVESRDDEINELHRKLDVVQNTVIELNRENEIAKYEYHRLKEQISRGTSRKGHFEITAYTHTGNLTASGEYPVAGRTVASNDFPIGTRLRINGNIYIVEDRGGMGSGVIDLFMDSEQECIEWGRRVMEVEVL